MNRKILVLSIVVLAGLFVFISATNVKTAGGEKQVLLQTFSGVDESEFVKNIGGVTETSRDVKIPDEGSETSKEVETSITISFAGDCTIGTDESFSYVNSFPYILKQQKNDYAYFLNDVKPIFSTDDLTLVNLETTLTTATKMAIKEFRFKGDPSNVNILKAGGVDMVNIANNHINDYLTQGFNDTLQTLHDNKILYSGMGHIAYYKKKGITVASIGYKGWDTSIKKNLEEDIKKAKMEAQIVIVSFHWGSEYAFYPNQTQTELGRFSVDCGADVVVGHHPHVIEGIEKYKGKYIVYSLGNFCFGGNTQPADFDAYIFQNKFKFDSENNMTSEVKIIPCSVSSVKNINDYRPTILRDNEKQRVLEKIYKLSSGLEYGIE